MVDFPLPINPINQMLFAFADNTASDPTGEAFNDLHHAAMVIIAVACPGHRAKELIHDGGHG